MMANNRARGATPNAVVPAVARGHLLAVAAITCVVAVAALVVPTDNVEANRPEAADLVQPVVLPEQPLDQPEPRAAVATFAEEPAAAEPPALATAEQPAPPLARDDGWRELIVQSGDSLSLLFKRAGYGDREVYEIIHRAPQGRALERIYPGQSIAFEADPNGELSAVKHVLDPLQSVIYRRMDGGYSIEKVTREPEVREAWASGEITTSLFLAGREAGLSSNLIMELANVFGGVIDFVLDPRKGDTMHVLYEELYLDGERFADGKIIAASFTNRGETFNAYRYIDNQGRESFYNENGVSMRKAFLMAPVDFTRISSNFNLARKHPIYKTTRPHRGTDYAAPRGTPVFAAGDGHVLEAGYTRANGNYVVLQHGTQYLTKYLHLHLRKVSKGQRVVQSQVIGTVGATGAATGPHLHYEFLVNGVHRNPRVIHKNLPKAQALAAAEMPRFKNAIANASTQLAMLQSGSRLVLNAVQEPSAAQ